MQLTSIAQCKVNQVVYHPVWGKGVVNEVTKINVIVMFYDFRHFKTFTDDKFCLEADLGKDHKISHLYTKRIFICERIMNGHDAEISYFPIKPESK